MTKWPYNVPALLEIGSQGSARIDEVIAIIRDISIYPAYNYMTPNRLLLNGLASNFSGYWPLWINDPDRVTKFDMIYIESSVRLIQVYTMKDLPLFLGYKYTSPLLSELLKKGSHD